jgi:sulfur carrier protein
MNVTLNGEPRELPAPLTLQQWLEQLNPGGSRVAVVVNERVIPAAERATLMLQDGDTVELLTFAGGG